ncbi:unnamed protein product [Schistosoma curassoni]|uniref:DUF4145 domain-containing protein n=1 Tax=Schistosoma curassoni TaxID=6186 RepID=A0A183JNC0_9TREM|nr:unnamed protein product [Schistosoma curassoni]
MGSEMCTQLRAHMKTVEIDERIINKASSIEYTGHRTAHTDLRTDVIPPTIEEISIAIRKINSEKAAELVDLPAEALKSNRNDCKHAARSFHDDLTEWIRDPYGPSVNSDLPSFVVNKIRIVYDGVL